MSDFDDHHPTGRTPEPNRVARSAATDWAAVCAELVGAHGAAIVAATPSHSDTHQVLRSTGPVADRVADLLYVLGIGPHLVSMTEDHVCAMTVDDAADRTRWPMLVGELEAVGVGWVQTYPIPDRDTVIGTVQLHRRTPPVFEVADGIVAFVSHLTRAIGAEMMSDPPGGPDSSRGGADIVDVAIGVLIERHGVGSGAASAMLRAGAYARSHSSVREARRVVGSIGSVDPW